MSDVRANAAAVDAALQASALTRKFGALTAVDQVTLTTDRPQRRGQEYAYKGADNVASADVWIGDSCRLRYRHSAFRRAPSHRLRAATASADGSLTGFENMLLSARLYGIPRRERSERIKEALARMGLSEVAHHLAGKYSGGIIRRLEIAQSFLHRPAVLFLDEPTVGLDPGARETVWEHVLDLRDKFGRTMIVTSHHMDEIDEFCDRIALIDRGRIAAIGTSSELKARVGPDATLDDVFLRTRCWRERN